MDTHRKRAKNYLTEASATSFWQIVNEAKVKKCDIPILDAKFIYGKSNVEIAMEHNCSVEKVNSVIKTSYDRVARLLNL